MEQKDYLMREVEKIGQLLRALLGSLLQNKENLSVTPDARFENTREMLMREIGFDLTAFLMLDETDTGIYLGQYKGIISENIELLAEVMVQLGLPGPPERKGLYLKKAIQLYE